MFHCSIYRLMFLIDVPAHHLEACFNILHLHSSPIIRMTHHAGKATVEHIPVALGELDHPFQYTARVYLMSRARFMGVPDE